MNSGKQVFRSVFNWVRSTYAMPSEVFHPGTITIAFDMQMQEWPQWCWAAAASSVSNFFDYDSAWTQAAVAANALGHGYDSKPDETWNLPFALDRAIDIVHCLKKGMPDAISFRAVARQLAKGIPVCARIEWENKDGHAAIIAGAWFDASGNAYYQIADPALGNGSVSDAELRSQYAGEGRWKATFMLQAPGG